MSKFRNFYFLLHGQTDWDFDGHIIGSYDIPLSDIGIRRAQKNAHFLLHYDIETICTSPMLRTRHTANIITEKLEALTMHMPEFNDANFGERQGKFNIDGFEFMPLWLQDKLSLIGSENIEGFLDRTHKGLLATLALPSQTLVVGHFSTYHAICHHLGMKAYPNITHSQLIYFSRYNGKWCVNVYDVDLFSQLKSSRDTEFMI